MQIWLNGSLKAVSPTTIKRMPSAIKPTHKAIARYYDALREYSEQRVLHEGALETAFQGLLRETGRSHKWFLILKESMKVAGRTITRDGMLRDEYNLPRGYWEAKDMDNDVILVQPWQYWSRRLA